MSMSPSWLPLMVSMFAEAGPVEPRTDATIATATQATRAVTRSHRWRGRASADPAMPPSRAVCRLQSSEAVRVEDGSRTTAEPRPVSGMRNLVESEGGPGTAADEWVQTRGDILKPIAGELRHRMNACEYI